jgi:protein O-mannosyl-transferase
MSKNKRKQPPRPVVPAAGGHTASKNTLLFALGACIITAIAFFPMLSNSFTNWDDPLYITENPMLLGPDWAGILSESVVSNYHPLTMASLALNYQLSGLSPFSYHLLNWLLHILNTLLVFYLAYRLSGGNRWVGFITALLFGVHPMHVESVAWASERKDVLFSAFFLAALLLYLRYIKQTSWGKYMGILALFALSLLSKPAAVTFPAVLLLLDWYSGRALKDKKVWLEKLPFFALALLFGLLALRTQADVAIADQTYYPIWQRAAFAVYGFGEYILRLAWPFPLSAIHPFPNAGVLPVSYYPAFFVALAAGIALWYFRKQKHVVFGIAFYAVNVALVLQFLAFGNAVIAERYTYLPYIGLLFSLAMLWAESPWAASAKQAVLGLFLLVAGIFALKTNGQVQVWKDSLSLWTKAIDAYPRSYVARSNRGHYLLAKLKRYDESLADYSVALEVEPDHANSLENRIVIYLNKQNHEAAMADADNFVRYHPNLPRAYLLRAFTADKLQKTDQAIADYGKCIELEPQNEEPRGNRGIIFYNAKQDYRSAKEDFDAAIRLNPKKGVNYVNRARCWVKFGNKTEALKDLEAARQLGEPLPEALVKAANLLQ